jgi:hypothetical protein
VDTVVFPVPPLPLATAILIKTKPSCCYVDNANHYDGVWMPIFTAGNPERGQETGRRRRMLNIIPHPESCRQ